MSQIPSRWLTLSELLVPFAIARFVVQRHNSPQELAPLPEVPVVVLPGLGSSDLATLVLRQSLARTGLQVHKGGIGRNDGDLRRLIPIAKQHVHTITVQAQQPTVLIGWSLGGIIAREIARDCPSKVRAVCCLGSPIVGGGRYSAYAPLYARRGYDLARMEELCDRRESVPIDVPSLSVYSKTDGIVYWQASIDKFNEHTTNVEVHCSHFAMGFSTEVLGVLHRWLATNLATDRNS